MKWLEKRRARKIAKAVEDGKGARGVLPLHYDVDDIEAAVDFLIVSATMNLPVGTLFEVRAHAKPRSAKESAEWGMVWVTAANPADEEKDREPVKESLEKHDPTPGVPLFVVLRLRTPVTGDQLLAMMKTQRTLG